MHTFAVFGNPIYHSLSPLIHQNFAKQTGVKISYDKILAHNNGFKIAATNFIKNGGNGFNITIPFKMEAHNFATTLTENAKISGAVNTIKVAKNGDLIGENTDGIGLVQDLTHNLNIDLKNKTVLILGAGGAASGIVGALLKCQPKLLLIANRTASKATILAKKFAKSGEVCGFDIKKLKPEPVDLIINATAVALSGQGLDLPTALAKNTICYDLMYGKKTDFMHWAAINNAKIVTDGLGMLVEQAAVSFAFWTDLKPETTDIIKAIKLSAQFT